MLHQLRAGIKEFYAIFSWRKRLLLIFVQAKLHRLSLAQTQFIGITGSAGKTTTKELCNLILSRLISRHDYPPVIEHSHHRSRNDAGNREKTQVLYYGAGCF